MTTATDLTRTASDLNLAPGRWPLLIDEDGRQWQRGGSAVVEGDLKWVTYFEQNKHTGMRTGAKMTVFND